MKRYIVDGNNMYHAVPETRWKTDQRRALVDYLASSGFFDGKRFATIVFDGAEDEVRPERPLPHIDIIYGGHRKADDVIQKLIEKEAKEHRDRIVIVTDDNQIIGYAKEMRVRAIKNQEFIGMLKKPVSTTEDLSQEEKDKITDELRKLWSR